MVDLVLLRDTLTNELRMWFNEPSRPISPRPSDIQPFLTWNLAGSPAINIANMRLAPGRDVMESDRVYLDILISAVHTTQITELQAETFILHLLSWLKEWWEQRGSNRCNNWTAIQWNKPSRWMHIPKQRERKLIQIELIIDPL